MRQKGRRFILAVLGLCMMLLCAACQKEVESTVQKEESKTNISGEEKKSVSEEAPEGYVYDYQVSMEPIPKEIADLGGTCVGTMHAFPTRIEKALTQQEVEKDPELKAEVERCTQEVKEALTEEIGGEFEVEIMSMDENKFEWKFFCREVATGYEFAIGYTNYKYNNPETMIDDNDIFIYNYYDLNMKKANKSENEKNIYNILYEIFPEGCNTILFRNEVNETAIFLAQFSNTDIDKEEEQIKILTLWERLKKYDSEMDYRIYIGYYLPEYEGLMEERCKDGIYEDIYTGHEDEKIKKIIDKQEIWDYFSYNEFYDQDNKINMSTLLSDYQNGTYDKNKIWEYWIGGNDGE